MGSAALLHQRILQAAKAGVCPSEGVTLTQRHPTARAHPAGSEHLGQTLCVNGAARDRQAITKQARAQQQVSQGCWYPA